MHMQSESKISTSVYIKMWQCVTIFSNRIAALNERQAAKNVLLRDITGITISPLKTY